MLKTSLSLFPKLLFRVKGESKREWSRGWWGFLAFCCSNSSLGAASMNTVGKRSSYGLGAVQRLLCETIPNSVADLESTQSNRVSNSCYEEVGHAIVSRSNFLRPLHMWSVLKSWNKAGIKPVKYQHLKKYWQASGTLQNKESNQFAFSFPCLSQWNFNRETRAPSWR